MWFKSLILFELLFQLPFFFVGYHAFYHGRNWVRIPGIAYGVHTATTLIPILAEIFTDEDIPTGRARAALPHLSSLPHHPCHDRHPSRARGETLRKGGRRPRGEKIHQEVKDQARVSAPGDSAWPSH